MSILFFSAIALVLSVVLEFFTIKFCHKHSLYDKINSRKIHTGNIPRLGGIAIVLANIISYILYSLIVNKTIPFNFVLLMLAGFIIFVFGVIDDLLELKAKQKLLVQIVAAVIVILGRFHFTQIFGLNLDANIATKIISFVVTLFWIVGVVNAYNLIDGLDGLCGSITFVTVLTYGLIFSRYAQNTAAIAFILAAAILGFLFFNWPPAKTFMGDNGSQFLGFSVAVIALYNEYKIPASMATFEFNKILVVLNLTALPIMDTIAAIWRRVRDHRPIMSPDRSHIHHKLLNIGFTKTQILLILLGIQTLVCTVVYLSTYMSRLNGMAVLLTTYAFMIVFFSFIHFANRAANRRMSAKK